MTRLTRAELLTLKQRAKIGDYDAIIELIQNRLDEAVDDLKVVTADHRYVQGKVSTLEAVLDDIISK